MACEVRIENIYTLILVKKGETVERNRAKKREQGIDTEGRGSGWKGESEREGSARELWWKDLCYHSWADWQNHSGYLVILARRMSITSGCFQCVVVCVCVCVVVCVRVCAFVCVRLLELFYFFKTQTLKHLFLSIIEFQERETLISLKVCTGR